MKTLKEQIRKTSRGGILELSGGEFNEQVIIKRPITIRSVPYATIVDKSPTLTIRSKNVILENLNMVSNDTDGIGLFVNKKNDNPVFRNVFIKGKTEGLDGEEGDWEIPDVLDLATLEPNKATKKKIVILCPVSARLYPSEIPFVRCVPETLTPGVNQIEIAIDEISGNTLIAGDLIIETLSCHLKRRISLIGNTLNRKPDTRQVLWICPSAKSPIHAAMLKSLPEGTQGESYEFVLDEARLKSRGYDIRVDGLPDGLVFDTTLFPKIEGIPETPGEFDVTFGFRKDNLKYRYSSTLKIREQVITPLKIASIGAPVELLEDETVLIKFDVLSSNSPDVTFYARRNLPPGLRLNESAGEISGRISEHGKYTSIIRIEDGTNELRQPVYFYVKPKHPLTLNMEKSYQFYKDKAFEIPIIIEDSDRLSPRIKLTGAHGGRFSVESVGGRDLIRGRLTELKTVDVEIAVEDKYKRRLRETLHIRCIEEPVYTFQWISTSPINIKGPFSESFRRQVKAEIKEDQSLMLNYSPIGDWPRDFHLTKDGTVRGKIDGKHYSVKIRAEIAGIEGGHSDKEFQIITSRDRSKIISAANVSSVFNYTSNHQIVTTDIKRALKNGRVHENYKDNLLAARSRIPDNLALTVSELPEGLTYNPEHFSIKGIPRKEGVYRIDVFNPADQSTVNVRLEIEKSPYYHVTDAPSENADEEKPKEKSKKKLLGKAFQI